jgi:LmbE family N-acetylglucosaminyl deacetylase
MLNFKFYTKNMRPKILCLGAHADDIEIGCGGTILKLLDDFPQSEFYWVVFSGDYERTKEAKQSANFFLSKSESKTISLNNFKESYFPFLASEIKDFFETLKQKFSPNLIFTHYKYDAHQDHQLLSNLTWNTFRNHLILEYEIPKYDGDLGKPNLFVHLPDAIVQNKVKYICDIFRSQKEKHWFSEDLFKSILRIRGIESNSSSKYAEGFYCRKIVVQ